jgi:hypothetical protein
MKTIHLSSQRDDGEFLVIGEMAWPLRLIQAIAGSYNPRWRWDYEIWNRVLLWTDGRRRELVAVRVAHSCDVAEKLWGDALCWHDDERLRQLARERLEDLRDVAAAREALARIEAGDTPLVFGSAEEFVAGLDELGKKTAHEIERLRDWSYDLMAETETDNLGARSADSDARSELLRDVDSAPETRRHDDYSD